MTSPDDSPARTHTTEEKRLAEDRARTKNWKRWGSYLSERQWATVREDYSAGGSCWDYFPAHDHCARSRAYRWGEDGLLGFTDRASAACVSPLALWNGRDPILKDELGFLFGLTGPEGNHGEDVKELYYYLDATPTHSWMRALYKYPQAEFPYAHLVEENRRRGLQAGEFEVIDTGVFDNGRYFDVSADYAKADPDHMPVRLTVANPADRRPRSCTCCRRFGSVTCGRLAARAKALNKNRSCISPTPIRFRPSMNNLAALRCSSLRLRAACAPRPFSPRTKPTTSGFLIHPTPRLT